MYCGILWHTPQESLSGNYIAKVTLAKMSAIMWTGYASLFNLDILGEMTQIKMFLFNITKVALDKPS